MDPGQQNVSGYHTDDMGIMVDAGGTGIPGPTIGLGGGAGGEIGGEKAMKAGAEQSATWLRRMRPGPRPPS
jgi:hypothetical protein